MSNRRIEMHRLQELVRLHRMGTGCREVARLLGMGPNTEREYRQALEKEGLLEGDPADIPAFEILKETVEKHISHKAPPQQLSTVEAWRKDIERMLRNGGGPRAIYDNLRLVDTKLEGKLSAIKRMCLQIKREQGVKAESVAIPVETDPGEVAQVDFGYVGRLYDCATGVMRRAWVFVLVLGYSRKMWAEIVFDQKVNTWLRLHVRAFEALGGVPGVLVPDNLKAAVIRAAFGVQESTALNRSYRELARHYGCKIDPTPPRSPQKKGKVESGVKYVRRNYIRPLDLEQLDAEDFRKGLSLWLEKIANERQHGTIFRIPRQVFEEEERESLLPLPPIRFEAVFWHEALVHADSHLSFDRRLYSVPWRLIGKRLWVRATAESVAIYADDVRVATHRRRGSRCRSTLDEHLPEYRADLRHRSREYWIERADDLGAEVGRYIREVFDSDDVLLQLRAVQAMVRLLSEYPEHRREAACRRALFYGSYSYRTLKRMLVQGLDLAPLPTAVVPTHGRLEKPRFARTAAELFEQLEVNDECN